MCATILFNIIYRVYTIVVGNLRIRTPYTYYLPDKILTSTSRKPNYRRHLESILFNNLGQTPPLTTNPHGGTMPFINILKRRPYTGLAKNISFLILSYRVFYINIPHPNKILT